MSTQKESNNDNDDDDTSTSRSPAARNLAAAAPPLPRRISPPNVILFLDNNQDARSTRSAIQRHTAHHAAAQRREARLQSSREVVPRNLEWQRRPVVDTSSPAGSDAPTPVIITTSPTGGPIEPSQRMPAEGEVELAGPALQIGERASGAMSGMARSSIGAEEQGQPVSSPILRSIGDDEACNNFLRAFRLALQAQSLPTNDARHWQAKESSLAQVDRGLGILRRRLENEHESCSDRTIQAVLVLFVYAHSFQSLEEAASHRAALEKMISLRGGALNFSHNAILEKQLQRYVASEVEQILHVSVGPGPPT